MPKLSKRRAHSHSIQLANQCWIEKNIRRGTESSTEESTGPEFYASDDSTNGNDIATVDDIADLFQLSKEKLDSKFISVLLFMTLRRFGITWRQCDAFLTRIGGLSCRTSQKWADIFVKGDFQQFCCENRGGKKTDEFYDIFPELELTAKAFALESCSKKSADFTAYDLAVFVDYNYFQLTDTVKSANDHLIRSVESCRLDLRRWGARFEANTQRPYFEGHDRDDIVRDRQKFIEHFLNGENHYFTVSDDDKPSWKTPSQIPSRILLCMYASLF